MGKKSKGEKLQVVVSPFRMFLYVCGCGFVVWMMIVYTVSITSLFFSFNSSPFPLRISQYVSVPNMT